MKTVPAGMRERVAAGVVVAVVVGVGLSWRSLTGGEVAKVGGDVLYATLIYALVMLVRPRTRWPTAVVVAVGVCWAVEFAQLTPWPAALSRHSGVARLVLGSTFHPADLASYLVGVLLGVLVGALVDVLVNVSRRRGAVGSPQ